MSQRVFRRAGIAGLWVGVHPESAGRSQRVFRRAGIAGLKRGCLSRIPLGVPTSRPSGWNCGALMPSNEVKNGNRPNESSVGLELRGPHGTDAGSKPAGPNESSVGLELRATNWKVHGSHGLPRGLRAVYWFWLRPPTQSLRWMRDRCLKTTERALPRIFALLDRSIFGVALDATIGIIGQSFSPVKGKSWYDCQPDATP